MIHATLTPAKCHCLIICVLHMRVRRSHSTHGYVADAIEVCVCGVGGCRFQHKHTWLVRVWLRLRSATRVSTNHLLWQSLMHIFGEIDTREQLSPNIRHRTPISHKHKHTHFAIVVPWCELVRVLLRITLHTLLIHYHTASKPARHNCH